MKREVSIDIDAEPQHVWDILTDVEHWPEWTSSVTDVVRLSPPPFKVGSRARIKQPRLKDTVWTVTALEPLVGFTWVARRPGVTTIALHRLEQRVPGTTTVTLGVRQRGVLAPLAWLLSVRMTRRYLELERHGLKARSEAVASDDAHQPRIVVAAGL
ncbi:MAG: SRPBCC family protein [Acidimicrobiales bacterium]